MSEMVSRSWGRRSYADLDHDAKGLDDVAGSEFVDDRIRNGTDRLVVAIRSLRTLNHRRHVFRAEAAIQRHRPLPFRERELDQTRKHRRP